MTKIKYDSNLIKMISYFEHVTRSKLHDCFISDAGTVMFVVEEGQMAKAIGKGGDTIRRVHDSLKRKIRLVEYSPDVAKFLANLISPLKAKIEERENILKVKCKNTHDRGQLIGRAATNLRNYESIVKRYFKIAEIKVE